MTTNENPMFQTQHVDQKANPPIIKDVVAVGIPMGSMEFAVFLVHTGPDGLKSTQKTF